MLETPHPTPSPRPARWLQSRAFDTALLVGLAALLAAVLVLPAAVPGDDDPTGDTVRDVALLADGQAIFEAEKCGTCHSVSTVGIEARMKTGKMAGGDLVGVVTADTDTEWLAAYLKGEAEKDGEAHTKKFAGSDEDLETLIVWLGEQE